MHATTMGRNGRENKRKCPLCSRAFSKTEHLERHIRSHTKEKPFECHQCGRKYGRNDSLLRHMRDQHPAGSENDPNATCPDAAEAASALTMSSNHDSGIDLSVAQTQADMQIISDMSMSHETSTSADIPNAPAVTHHYDPSTFSHASFFEGGSDLEFGNWLISENFGDAMHTWPFVIDENDVPPPVNPIPIAGTNPPADLQGAWFTHVESENQAQSGYVTPVQRRGEIDDDYRLALHQRLQVRSSDQSLPSVQYLNLCLKWYFRRFHPIFPIVHAATFVPRKSNAVLLLSICSIGSLLTGHPQAYQRGVQLFERLHKAILAHWERLMRHGPENALAVVQASLIGQTFGLLSGQAKHIAIVDAFHGTVISLARRCKVFQTEHTIPTNPQDVSRDWKSWVQTEEKLRVALALRIHDAEIAGLLHHETFLPSASKRSRIPNDSLFAAANAQEWLELYKGQETEMTTPSPQQTAGLSFPYSLSYRLSSIHDYSYFTVYAALEDICCEIVEARMNESLTTAATEVIEECLILFYQRHLRDLSSESSKSGNRILWHYLFILLHSDLDLLERSIGRDGPSLDAVDHISTQTWARSASAQRCVAHTIMIKRNLESFPLNSEPAIHVPRCVFAGIICLFCYAKYGDISNGSLESFPEIRLFDTTVTLLLKEVRGGSLLDGEIGTLYGLVDLLQRIGHWEVSRTFASIAGVLLQAESR